MSILTGPAIRRALDRGEILISPFDEKYLGPNSYDLHLGDRLLAYKIRGRHRPWTDPFAALLGQPAEPEDAAPDDPGWWVPPPEPENLDTRKNNPTRELPIPPTGLILVPGVLYLGETAEYTETGPYVPSLDGRSSTGRLGIFIHVTAGRGETGYRGKWTCEIVVIHPVRVYPGDRLMQISYQTTEGAVVPYAGRYQDSQRVTASRLFLGDLPRAASQPPPPPPPPAAAGPHPGGAPAAAPGGAGG